MNTNFGTRHWNEYTRIEWNYSEAVYYDCYEASGLIRYMRGHEGARAIFGNFEVAFDENTNRKIVRWTVYLGTLADRERYGTDNWIGNHETSNGEWWDDLNALQSGNVEYY